MIPTPQVMPKPDLKPISHLKLTNKQKKTPPPHWKGPYNLIGTPSSPHAIIFGFHNLPLHGHNAINISPKRTQLNS